MLPRGFYVSVIILLTLLFIPFLSGILMDSQTYQLNKKKYHPSGEGRFLSILLSVDTVHLHGVFFHGRYYSTLSRIAHFAPRYRFAWSMVEDLDHWSVGTSHLFTYLIHLVEACRINCARPISRPSKGKHVSERPRRSL